MNAWNVQEELIDDLIITVAEIRRREIKQFQDYCNQITERLPEFDYDMCLDYVSRSMDKATETIRGAYLVLMNCGIMTFNEVRDEMHDVIKKVYDIRRDWIREVGDKFD